MGSAGAYPYLVATGFEIPRLTRYTLDAPGKWNAVQGFRDDINGIVRRRRWYGPRYCSKYSRRALSVGLW